jgi:HEAT repeat protein
MRRRQVLWLVVVAVAVGAAAVLIPGTPVYLPNLLTWSGLYEAGEIRSEIRALDSPDAEARHHAIHDLGDIGPEAGAAVPALVRILRDSPDRQSRGEAALALLKMAPASKGAVPALAQALDDKEPVVRMNAALALFRLGTESRPAVPALIKALDEDRNENNLQTFTFTIRMMAARALGRASAGTAEGVPALSAALEASRNEAMTLAVTRALGEVGPEARPAVPRLRQLLKDNSKDVRQAAEEALQHIEAAPAETSDPNRAGGAPDKLELPESERAYLWEIEHHGNLLVKRGFGPLAEALKGADAAALSRLLADDFAGTDLGQPRRVRAATDYAEVERLQDAGRPPVPLDRDAFVARLLDFRKGFAGTPGVKFALMTLSPKVRGQLDGPWEGTAQLRLFGEHAPGAPAEVVLLLRYEVPRPTAEALARPGWLRAAGVQQVLQARAPHYLFAEVTRQRGLDPAALYDSWTSPDLQTAPGGVYVCDFDRDGVLDVLVTDVTGNALYRGLPGGTFEDVTRQYGLPRQRSGSPPVAVWVDIDGDGWEDLILGDRVYRNDGGRHFTDYTDRCNFRLPPDASGAVVADYDRDGKLDLYVTRPGRPAGQSWLDGKSGESQGNFLFHNKGGWQFEDVTRASGTLGGHRSTFTAAWLDADNDGWPDLYVPNEFGDGVLLVNNRDGTFSEHALADRPADFGSMGLAVGDVNNDGTIDIFCANMYSKAGTRVIGNLAPDAYPPAVLEKMRRFVAGSQLHLNKGGLNFEQVGKKMQVAAVGWSYGACLADLDNDGWLDVYATCGFVSKNRTEPDG